MISEACGQSEKVVDGVKRACVTNSLLFVFQSLVLLLNLSNVLPKTSAFCQITLFKVACFVALKL